MISLHTASVMKPIGYIYVYWSHLPAVPVSTSASFSDDEESAVAAPSDEPVSSAVASSSDEPSSSDAASFSLSPSSLLDTLDLLSSAPLILAARNPNESQLVVLALTANSISPASLST